MWLIVVVALIAAWLDGRGAFDVADPRLFIHAGKQLLGSHPLDVFADRTVQEGPLALLFWGVVGRIADLVNVQPRAIAAVASYLGFSVALAACLRAAFGELGRPSADVELLAVVVFLFGGLGSTMLSTGHFAEGAIPLLWFQAARTARSGRVERAGLLVAVAAGLKLWGALGVPILFLDPDLDWARLVRGAVVAVGVGALFYAPFALFGTFHLLDYRWDVARSSFLHRLFPGATSFSWRMRVLQSGLVVVAGCALALFGRLRRHASWAVPIGIVAVKLLLDPIVFEYYPVSLALLGLLAAGLLVAGWPSWLRLVPVVVIYVVLYPAWLLDGSIVGVVALGAAVVASLAPVGAAARRA